MISSAWHLLGQGGDLSSANGPSGITASLSLDKRAAGTDQNYMSVHRVFVVPCSTFKSLPGIVSEESEGLS